MRNIILTLSAIALLLGCTSKEEKVLMQAYEKNKSYHKQKHNFTMGLSLKYSLQQHIFMNQVIKKKIKEMKRLSWVFI